MKVKIIATKVCSHCINMSKELNDLCIAHEIVYAEDNPELCQKFSIRHSPNLLVDEQVIYRRQPTEQELRAYFLNKSTTCINRVEGTHE